MGYHDGGGRHPGRDGAAACGGGESKAPGAFVEAYSAGLRVGEGVRLRVSDIWAGGERGESRRTGPGERALMVGSLPSRLSGTTWAQFEASPFSLLHGMALDSEGHVWVSDLGSPSVAEYYPATQQWNIVGDVRNHVALTPDRGFPPIIWGIATDLQTNSIWIATSDIVEIKGSTWQVHQPQYEPSTIYIDADGYKWLGVSWKHRGGLLLISPDGQRWWFWPGGNSHDGISQFDRISDITRDVQGNFWFATSNGAIRFSPSR